MESTESFDKQCLVCGKNVENGGGLCHLKVGDNMIALCCPLCIETYEKSPERYATKLTVLKLNFSSNLDPTRKEI
jgi:hypothetical protein